MSNNVRGFSRRQAAGLVVLSLAVAALPACSPMGKVAHSGHDYLENPGRTCLVRAPAGLGTAVGYVLATPFSILLLPSYAFEDACARSSLNYDPEAEEGDISIPWVLVPFDYGSGVSAAIFGCPFEAVVSIFRKEPPGPPPYTVPETPDLPPGEKDPALSFAVNPPAASP
jgi:hypothetical protein